MQICNVITKQLKTKHLAKSETYAVFYDNNNKYVN